MADPGGTLLEVCYEAGWMIWPILLLAGVALWTIITRTLVLAWTRLAAGPSLRRLDEILDGRRLSDLADGGRGPISRVLASAVPYLESPAQIAAALTLHGRREVRRLYRRLNLLGMVVVVAPLCGFLGTVTGVVDSWGISYCFSGASYEELVCIHIAESLWTTAVGLAVAITAQLARIGLRTWAERSEAEIENAGSRLLQYVATMGESTT